MEPVVLVVVALLAVVLAWKLLKGLAKTVVLVGILALAAGQQPKEGTQDPKRHTVEPVGGPTSLTAMVGENHDYRDEWA